MKRQILFWIFVMMIFGFSIQVNPQTGSDNLSLTVAKTGDGAGLIVSSPPGIECGDGGGSCNATFTSGTPVTLTPQEKSESSIFEGWPSANGSPVQCMASKGPCSFIINENSSITGNFILEAANTVMLTVTVRGGESGIVLSSPPGIRCGADNFNCTAAFPPETSVTLSTQPLDEKTVFEEWSGGTGSAITCNDNIDACTLTITEDSSTTATFVRKE